MYFDQIKQSWWAEGTSFKNNFVCVRLCICIYIDWLSDLKVYWKTDLVKNTAT